MITTRTEVLTENLNSSKTYVTKAGLSKKVTNHYYITHSP